MKPSNVAWYDVFTQEYYERSRTHFHPVLQSNFLKLLPKRGKILDHGCGFGRDAKIFEDAGYTVIGIDLSKELLKLASEVSPTSLLMMCDISKALPFIDESFDGVWSMTILIHLKTLRAVEKSLKEVFRVLREGGVIHIITGHKFSKTRLFVTDTTPRRTFLRMTEQELASICERLGFKTKICKVLPETEMTNDGRSDISWVYYLGTK